MDRTRVPRKEREHDKAGMSGRWLPMLEDSTGTGEMQGFLQVFSGYGFAFGSGEGSPGQVRGSGEALPAYPFYALLAIASQSIATEG